MEETTTANRKTKSAAKTAAAKTPKATKTATPKASASSTSTRTKSASGTKSRLQGSGISSEQRNRMIETAAYYIAERNGFCSNPVDDWLTAENQINQQLG